MTLLVVTGPPGAGKSTVAARLAASFEPSVLVAGDELFGFLRTGAVPPWLPASEEQNTVVLRAAARAAGAFAEGGYVTIFDGVVGPWFLDMFARGTGLDSFDYVVLLPTEERCVERVASRSGHGFTDEAAGRHMHQQFATRTAALDPKHLLADPPDDADETARLIVDGMKRGRFTYRIAESPGGESNP